MLPEINLGYVAGTIIPDVREKFYTSLSVPKNDKILI